MGQSQSASQSSVPTHALHVLRVTPSSPASRTSIEPFFDFVVGYDGDDAMAHSNVDVAELERIVEAHENRTLNLLVWNSKDQQTRVVSIIPSRAWSQQADSQTQPSLLGLSMRICEPEFALDNVWHVLDVVEGSPAESAGLVPYGDYITGWSGGVLSAENDFYDLVEAHVDKPLRVYVYSHDFDALREVVLVPNRHWGGTGLLGCVFGYGFIHRIPPRPTAAAMTEIHEEYEDQSLFVPVDDPRVKFDKWNSGGASEQGQLNARDSRHNSVPPILEEEHLHHHGHDHDHNHDHDHGHDHNHNHDHGHGHSHDSEPLPSPALTPKPHNVYSTRPPPLNRPSFSGSLLNGSRSSTPIATQPSITYSPSYSEDEGDTDATSQGSLTSVD